MSDNKQIEDLKSISATRKIEYHYFAGNWCPMCVVSTPKVMAVMNQMDVKAENLHVHSVNPMKSEPREHIKRFDISRVPTLVILEDDNEIGRITEYTDRSWAEDIAGIIQG
jgi:hypothetical protein